MKRLIACALLLAMLLTLFAGCNSSANTETTPPTEGEEVVVVDTSALDAAVEYVKTIYKDVEESTPVDFQRIGAVRIGTQSFSIVWTADVAEDLVKIVESNGMVTVDVSDANPEDVPYVLTATISDANGNSKSLSWHHFLPAAIVGDFSEILDMAYALEDGESLPNACSLTGIISTINTAWSEDYKNITVTIVMEGCEDKPVMCYRLAGEGAKDLAPGDQITVTGTIKNYKGTIEFDQGCTLDAVVQGVGETVKAPEDPKQILDEAYALANNQALPYTATLTGEIISVDTAWSDKYQNITVTIAIEGDNRTVMCYRLKGDGAKDLWLEDIITVKGTIKNYNGTIEFDAGCELIDVIPGRRYHGKLPKQPDDPLQIVDEAYKLTEDSNLPYNVRISGYVTAIISPWNDTYHNTTVNIVIPGREDKPIQCYRMHGSENGADTLEVGDYITVFGSIKNYKGTIEFFAGAHCEKVVKGDGSLPWVPDLTPEEIVDAAYALEQGKSMANTYTLTGKVTQINTPYSDQYKNITVTIVVAGRETKPIECYRMKGTDAANVEVGDTITVTGVLKNYYGKIEFDTGCTLDALVKAPKAPTLAEALAEAAALANGKYTPYEITVEGKVTEINTPYSSQYNNITFTIDVDGTSIYCYRIKGEGMDTLAVGDTVKLVGPLTAYNGKPQFDSKAVVTVIAKAGGSELTGLAKDLADAAALANGQYLDHDTTIEGKVTVINTPYSTQFNNITFTVDVDGTSVYCYRIKGEGMDTLAVGDTVKLVGPLTAYNGKAQFDSKAVVTVVAKAGAPKPLTEALAEAAALANGKYLDYETTVEGKVTVINTPYSSQYNNITFTIDVDGTSVYCYRIKGTGMDTLAVGDTVKLVGKLTAYNGNPQFDSTAAVTVTAKAGPVVDASSPLADVLAAAAALQPGEKLDFTYTITGTISTAYGYNSTYENHTVIMDVLDTTVQCYRLKGTGVDAIAVGDTITVTGVLGKNSSGYIRFEEGDTLVSWVDNTP